MRIQPAELQSLIERNRGVVDFADFGQGTSDHWCGLAERALGFRLPPSLRWWLTNYGGGEVLGEEIFSIYEQDFDSVVGGDIVRQYRKLLRAGFVSAGQLPICQSDVDGLFYVDTVRVDEVGESPVVSQATGADYAVDFSEFLAKRIALSG